MWILSAFGLLFDGLYLGFVAATFAVACLIGTANSAWLSSSSSFTLPFVHVALYLAFIDLAFLIAVLTTQSNESSKVAGEKQREIEED